MRQSEQPNQHFYKGVEIWTQIWYDSLTNDTPKLKILVNDFLFCNIYTHQSGRWFFGDDSEPKSGNSDDGSLSDFLSAYGIAKEFLSCTVI